MEEIIFFQHKIVLSFSDLNDFLKKTIETKLKNYEFNDYQFEVLKIINFVIKEMLVNEKSVICKLKVKAIANVPKIGKIIDITENFIIKNENLIYSNNRLQLIAQINPNILKQNKTSFKIKIEAIKQLSKNILCAGVIVNDSVC